MDNDGDSSPRTTDTLVNPPRPQQALEGGEARAYLENFVSAAYQSGPDAQFEYDRAVLAIRKIPEAILIEIAQALGKCESHDYPTRWALTFAASELRHRSALSLLASVVDTPLPSEPQPPSHGFSVVANETVLRTTAIEGIGHLAREGHKEALEVLFRVLREPSISLRRASVQAILGVRRSSALIKRLKASLPPENHFLLELKRAKVTEVPQIPRPQQYLSEEAGQRTPRKPPAAPGIIEKSTPSRPPTRKR